MKGIFKKEMKQLNVGGKITLKDKKSYRIVDIVKFNEKEYFFCCTVEKPIKPKVFEKKEIDEKMFIKFVEDPVILKNIALKILK